MGSVSRAVVRLIVVLAIGIVTFIPDFGLLSLAIASFPTEPVLVATGALLWSIVLALLLPLRRTWFLYVSTGAITAIMAVAIYQARIILPVLIGAWPWFMWLAVIVFTDLGWLMIATPLWRWARGVVAVEDSGAA